MLRVSRAVWIALLCMPLLARAADANANGPQLAPSAAVQCLDEGGPDNRLVYPPDLLERKDGGTVEVQLTFDAPDDAPSVDFPDKRSTWDELIDAVRRHVRHFRVPCMKPGDPPVVLKRSYVFVPNDGRKVVSTTSVDADDIRRKAMLACVRAVESLSGILCVRHTMTDRSMYAEQDEGEERGDCRQDGGAAEDPQGTA